MTRTPQVEGVITNAIEAISFDHGRMVVAFKNYESFELIRPPREVWSVTDNRWTAWLQRLCFWALRKMGSKSYDHDGLETYRVVVNTGDFLRDLGENIDTAKYVFGRAPRKIFIGSKTFGMIMRESSFNDAFGGPIGFDVKVAANRTLYNLPVELIPWMEGALVI